MTPYVIALEGPTAIGKTTLTRELANNPAVAVIPEYYELQGGLPLAGYDPLRDELCQLSVFFSLLQIECGRQRAAREARGAKRLVLMDRSLFSLVAYEFARFHDRETWRRLARIVDECSFLTPDLILYIDAPISIVRERAIMGGMRGTSSVLSNEFLTLSRAYFEERVSLRTTVKVCALAEARDLLRKWSAGEPDKQRESRS